MNEVETIVYKNIVTFCKALSPHVEKWRSLLQESTKVVQGVSNLAEQLRYVHEANIKYMDDFEEAQKSLKFQIINCLEEDIIQVKSLVEKLSKANQDLRNKLIVLENSTLVLDWNEESTLIRGCGSVPSLTRLLQSALEYWNYFQNAFKNISSCVKNMDCYKLKSMVDFEKAFNVNLDDKVVTYLICITQYVDNEKAIL